MIGLIVLVIKYQYILSLYGTTIPNEILRSKFIVMVI